MSKLSGVIGFFDDPHSLTVAMEKVRDAKFEAFDAFTPYPVHGLNEAQGLPRSWLPWVTFVMGVAGFTAAFGLQYWTSVIDWPLNVGGKPFNSWPAFVPIMFELTVLFAGLSTAAAMILVNGLPNTKTAAFDPSITKDRFAIWIGAKDGSHKKFSESDAQSLLKSSGAKEVRTVYDQAWF